MIDQYNMDQYNKETSEIHAPADLICRTKEAVREEEQRIARERLQQNSTAQPKHSYGKVYRWALPVAAAVLCVIIFNISGIMPERNMSGSGAAMDMDSGAAQSSDNGMGMQSGGIDTTVNEAAEAVAEEESVNEDIEYEIAASDTAGEEYINEDQADMQFADEAASVRSDAYSDSSVKNSIDGESESKKAESGYIESIYGGNIWIEEIEETPAFYNSPNTESVTIRDIELYVGKDIDETWIAYAEIKRGKYMICTEYTEEEITWKEFAEEACKLLEDTVYNSK